MIIGRITFSFTHGISISGNVSFNPHAAVARVPDTLHDLVKRAQDGACFPEVEMTADGVSYRLREETNGLYHARIAEQVCRPRKRWRTRLIDGVTKPSREQYRQMGKTVHAVAVPCISGAAALSYADHFDLTGANILAVTILLLGTLALLALGNALLEDPDIPYRRA
jgi:hypothetical protein